MIWIVANIIHELAYLGNITGAVYSITRLSNVVSISGRVNQSTCRTFGMSFLCQSVDLLSVSPLVNLKSSLCTSHTLCFFFGNAWWSSLFSHIIFLHILCLYRWLKVKHIKFSLCWSLYIRFPSLNVPRHDKTNQVSVRPAKTQISLGIRPVWSASSLSAWRNLGSLATH